MEILTVQGERKTVLNEEKEEEENIKELFLLEEGKEKEFNTLKQKKSKKLKEKLFDFDLRIYWMANWAVNSSGFGTLLVEGDLSQEEKRI